MASITNAERNVLYTRARHQLGAPLVGVELRGRNVGFIT